MRLTEKIIVELLLKNVQVEGLDKEKYIFKPIPHTRNLDFNKFKLFRITDPVAGIIPVKHMENYIEWKVYGKTIQRLILDFWIDCNKPPLWTSNNEYRVKPERTFKVGDVFRLDGFQGHFLLAHVQLGKVNLIHLESGNRFDDNLVKVRRTSAITCSELKQIIQDSDVDTIYLMAGLNMKSNEEKIQLD